MTPHISPLLVPDDARNRALVEQVHPPSWKNPEPARRYNLVVVGADTAGLVAAVGAAGLGAKLADAWNRARLTPRVRSLVEGLLRWRR